jgi:hypothetical protein
MDWILTMLLLVTLYLSGKNLRSGWAVGIFSQVLWIAYAIATKQYGFLLGAVLVGAMYVKNWFEWGEKP